MPNRHYAAGLVLGGRGESAGPMNLSVSRVYRTFWGLAALPRNVFILSIPSWPAIMMNDE